MAAKKVHCPGPRGRFCRVRLADPKKFAKKSFRVIRRGKIKLTVACPKGSWDAKRRRCRAGTRAQSKMYPVGHSKCRACRR